VFCSAALEKRMDQRITEELNMNIYKTEDYILCGVVPCSLAERYYRFRGHQDRNVSRLLRNHLFQKQCFIIIIIIIIIIIYSMVHHFFENFVVIQLVKTSFVSIGISSRSGLNILTD
jgi:hypothetical protein